MVTVTDYKRRENAAGEEFFVLFLQGDIELVKSSETGKHYATARRTTITTTFNEVTCQQMVGKTLKGSINKVKCDPYNYDIQETGETIQLEHTYEYSPEEKPQPMEAPKLEVQAAQANGVPEFA